MDRPQRWFRGEAVRRLAFPAAVTATGLPILRVFFPSLAWYLRDTVGVDSATLGLYAFGAFSVVFLAGLLRRLLGPLASLWLAAGGLALVRLLEQVSAQPAADLWLSLIGTGLFCAFLPLWLGHLRATSGPAAAPRLAFGVWLGLALDSAVRGAAWTLDMSWLRGFAPLAVSGALAAAILWLLLFEPAPEAGEASDSAWVDAWPLLGLGPFLLLQMMIFQNFGLIAEVGGLTPQLAFFAVLAGNVLGVMGSIWGFGRPATFRTGRALVAAAYLAVVAATIERLGAGFPLTVLVSQLIAGWALAAVAGWVVMRQVGGLLRSTIVIGAGLILFLVMAFIYYVSLDLRLPVPRAAIFPTAAALFGAAATLVALRRGAAEPHAWMDRTPLVPAVLLLLVPLADWARGPQALPPTAPPPGPIRLINYNVHSAFSVAGRQDPEAIAAAIEASGAAIVGLQEVSRGWLIDGSTDLAAWLSRRLGMPFLFRGTSDAIWGNALLTTYPILESGGGDLPQQNTLIRRGFLWARLDVGWGDPLMVIVTHLHQIESDSDVRQAQAAVLLEAWGGAAHTILAGDMNAEPGSPEMEMLSDAGLLDAWSLAGSGEGLTYRADAPDQRIDWVWVTPDLVVVRAETPRTTASDHLPVVVALEYGP